MAAANGTPKPKTDRKMLGWVFGIVMVGLIAYLLVTKGPDLGQKEVTAKRQAAEDKKKNDMYQARVQDPEAASRAQFEAAQRAVNSKRAKEQADAAAAAGGNTVPPPPMGPATSTALAPPAPSESDRDVSKLQMSRLDNANRVVNGAQRGSTGGAQAPARASFVAYSASEDEKGPNGSIAKTVFDAADVKKGENPDDAHAPDVNDNPDVKRAQSNVDKAIAAQAALAEAQAQANAQPGSEGNEAWLYKHQTDKLKAPATIVAERYDGLYWVAPGSVINIVMLNAIDTSLPGHVVARVTQTVYDSRYGKYPVIYGGATVEGEYNSKIVDGQHRVQFAFNTMVTPAGGQVAINGMAGGDAQGRSGVDGDLHTHFGTRMGIATLMAIEAVGMDRLSKQTQVVAGSGVSGPPPVSSGGQIMVNAANEELKRRFAVGPNITIPAGEAMSIITTSGIEIPPLANAR